MSKVKILVIGPSKAGKTTIANILGDLQEGPSTIFRPTVGCRIVDFERDSPSTVSQYGRINVELWDLSGDLKFEKCWAPAQVDIHGIIFVYDPTNPDSEDDLKRFVEAFPKALRFKQKNCMCFINNHNSDGQTTGIIPKCMENLDKWQGTAEDSQGIFTKFESYLTILIKGLIEKQADDEKSMM